MAQDFSMRCLMVDGQGNFGSVDGDPPAAMRYTEAKLTQASLEMLKQIDKNTVDFSPNFDGTLFEPDVLPAAIPNLLVNGATGIAVGMATSIPPHNLGEVVDALIFMLTKWSKLDDVSVEDLMKFIKGPDFPTGGVIIQDPAGVGLASVYGSGRGKVIMQARAHLEEMERGKNRIIVTELPYMVNKASMIEKIADLVRTGNLEGVVDLRDESDRQGLRVVIELSKSADSEIVLRSLYKRTQMQSTFSIALLALVAGEPRLLTLKQALKVFLDHRLVVIKRKGEYELEKARQRAHILEGMRIAIKYLDEIVALIRNSSDAEEAKLRLMKKYKLSEIQAQAILDMPLKRLAALERRKIEEEYRELVKAIKQLEDLVKSPEKIREKATEELSEIKETFADKRKTQIIGMKEGGSLAQMLTVTDLMDSEDIWIGMNEAGEIARSNANSAPWMFGKEAAAWMLRCNTHHTLYIVSDTGKAAAIPVHSVPEASQISEGTNAHKISALGPDDNIAAIFSLPQKSQVNDSTYLTTFTRSGMIKKSAASDLPGPSAQTFQLCKVNEGDVLGWVLQSDGSTDFMMASLKGMCIRFSEDYVRPMGLVAAGVAGMKFAAGDEVVNVTCINKEEVVILAASDGKAKRIANKDFPTQGRYGMGVIGWRMSPGIHLVGMMSGKNNDRFVAHFMRSASKSKRVDEVPSASRAAQGKKVFEVKPGDQVIGITSIWDGGWDNGRTSRSNIDSSSSSEESDQNVQLELFKPDKATRKKTAGEISTSRNKSRVKGKPSVNKTKAAQPLSKKKPEQKVSSRTRSDGSKSKSGSGAISKAKRENKSKTDTVKTIPPQGRGRPKKRSQSVN